jgi:hypothetical protein
MPGLIDPGGPDLVERGRRDRLEDKPAFSSDVSGNLV